MENLELKAKLGQKINALMDDVGSMKKDGRNDYSGYDYISHEAMATRMRGLLPKHGLSIIPSIVDIQERDFAGSGGKVTVRTVVTAEIEIIDTETGFSIVKRWVGADQDVGGKSCGQAVTETMKRFYFKLLNVTSNDEKDPDSKTTEVISPKPTKAGFYSWLLKNGFDKARAANAGKTLFGDKATDSDVKQWVTANGWNIEAVIGQTEFYEEEK